MHYYSVNTTENINVYVSVHACENGALTRRAHIHINDHTTPIFLKFNILKLFDLFEYKDVCFMYLVYWRKLVNNLQNLYVRNISNYGLRNPYYYKKKKVNSYIMKMCMSVYGTDLLQNNLSMVQNSESLYIYKRRYKDNLLVKYKE